ncbi:hypothetical protein B0187_00465 [Haemophilus paracuniculus]|uniref:NERD domain-containing protein n=1 Tax=Haemophilus paracuniculus TaxID=734 RepID=A0A1T0AVZ3_9PAST|nr:NERD domain-containing protein [Haemophilus paracuniculus]OOS00806.1 hypothetical protein B0187_00465 [Haemophilus paracuniculus]
MGFKAYRNKAGTIHENQAFSTLCSYLNAMWENKTEELTLFGSVSFYVNDKGYNRKYDFDAIAVTNNLVIVIDFKDFGGWLRDNNTSSENPWLMYDGDKLTFKIKGGTQPNPYIQLVKNRKGLAQFIEKNYISSAPLEEIEDKCNGFLIFHKEVKNLKEANERLPRNVLSWFRITDLELENIQHYVGSLSRQSTFTVSELEELRTALKDRVSEEFTSFPRIKINTDNQLRTEIDHLLSDFEWLKKSKNNEFVKKLTKFKEEYSINLESSINTILKLNHSEFLSNKDLIPHLSHIEIKESEINFAREIKKKFSFEPILYLEEEFDINEYGYSIRSRDRLLELVKELEESIAYLKSRKEYEFMDHTLKNNMNYFGENKLKLISIEDKVLEYFNVRDDYLRAEQKKKDDEIMKIEQEAKIRIEEERIKREQERTKKQLQLEKLRLEEEMNRIKSEKFRHNIIFTSLFVLVIVFNIFIYYRHNLFIVPSLIGSVYLLGAVFSYFNDIVFKKEVINKAIYVCNFILVLWGLYALSVSISIWWIILLVILIMVAIGLVLNKEIKY